MYRWTLLPVLLIIFSCKDIKEKITVIHDTAYVTLTDTIYLKDIQYLDSVYALKRQNILKYADSVFALRRYEIAKIHTEALSEVQLFRAMAQYQVDTMRSNFLKLKNTKIYNNMLIRGDTLRNVEAVFGSDSVPKIIIR